MKKGDERNRGTHAWPLVLASCQAEAGHMWYSTSGAGSSDRVGVWSACSLH